MILYPHTYLVFAQRYLGDNIAQLGWILGSTFKLAHLIYIDDLLLFAHGDASSTGILILCLQEFGVTVVLQINRMKSNIYMARVDNTTSKSLLSIIEFQDDDIPFRYLEIPLVAKQLRLSDYSPLIYSLIRKINSQS